MTLRIEIRNVYGEDKAYPAGPVARTFADIAGTKTLRIETLKLAKVLGYRIEIVGKVSPTFEELAA